MVSFDSTIATPPTHTPKPLPLLILIRIWPDDGLQSSDLNDRRDLFFDSCKLCTRRQLSDLQSAIPHSRLLLTNAITAEHPVPYPINTTFLTDSTMLRHDCSSAPSPRHLKSFHPLDIIIKDVFCQLRIRSRRRCLDRCKLCQIRSMCWKRFKNVDVENTVILGFRPADDCVARIDLLQFHQQAICLKRAGLHSPIWNYADPHRCIADWRLRLEDFRY